MGKDNPLAKKPIDVANDEIRNLKKQLAILRSELTLIKSHMKLIRDDYHKRMADEEQKDKECVIESRSWWWG